MAEVSSHNCPNGCTYEEDVPVLLWVKRDEWDYRDGYHCHMCLEDFDERDIRD